MTVKLIRWNRFNSCALAVITLACATGCGDGGNPASSSSTVSADLVIAVAGPASATFNSTISYTMMVTNRGPSAATGVVVRSPVADPDFISAAPAGACSSGGGMVVCNVGNLGVNASATITITVRATPIGSRANSATVSGNEGDPNSANNSATVTTAIN